MLRAHPGSSPQYSKGTYIPVFPTKDRQSPWAGRITNKSDNTITMGITPAADCIVGKYHMYVAVATPYGIRRTRRDISRDLYILFNPWVAGGFRPHNHNSFFFVPLMLEHEVLALEHPHDPSSFLRWCCVSGRWEREGWVCDEWDGDHLPRRLRRHLWEKLELWTGRRKSKSRTSKTCCSDWTLFVFSSSTMESWMPVCTSWTGLRCLSPTEETPSKWPERRLLW